MQSTIHNVRLEEKEDREKKIFSPINFVEGLLPSANLSVPGSWGTLGTFGTWGI